MGDVIRFPEERRVIPDMTPAATVVAPGVTEGGSTILEKLGTASLRCVTDVPIRPEDLRATLVAVGQHDAPAPAPDAGYVRIRGVTDGEPQAISSVEEIDGVLIVTWGEWPDASA